VDAPSSIERARGLAHAAVSAGQRAQALRAYERILARDPLAAVDTQMVANLIACFGQKRTQPTAAALIVRFQITDVRAGLQELAREGRTKGTRRGARYTLEKLRSERPPAMS
jgi:hypothetical protein